MSALLELAERCEAATEADRLLDRLIFMAVYPDIKLRVAARYTQSIDAAVTLVPEGWWWSTGNCSISADASMGPDFAHCPKEMLVEFDAGIHGDLAHPSNPALALCAAALRARAAIAKATSLRPVGDA